MSGYLLDTSIIIDYLRKREDVVSFVDKLEEDVYSSYVCVGELYVGVFRDNNRTKAEESLNLFLKGLTEMIGLNQEIMRHFGEIVADLFQKGETIGEMDALIAATCVANDLTLVTKNSKHFLKIKNCKVLSL